MIFPRLLRPSRRAVSTHSKVEPFRPLGAFARTPCALVAILFGSGVFSAAFAAAPEPFPPIAPDEVGLSSDSLESLASKVDRYLEEEQIVGAELMVIKDRRTVLHRAFGMRDVASDRPMQVDTIFNIRSMTKPLTGAALQILIDEGRVKLEDPVAKYLPAFDTDDSRAITVDQVLSHRSGLPLTVVLNVKQHDDLQSQAGAAGKRGPQFEPGEKFWYSDAGTDVVGAVVEKVAGMTLDAFWKERLLEPLSMNDTLVANDPDDPRRPRLATIYFGRPGYWHPLWTPERESFYRFAWGSQSLSSTTRDYARFLAMWMDGGRVGERQILTSDAIRRTLTPISELTTMGSDRRMPTGFSGRTTFYGRMAQLWMKDDADQPEIVGHSGSDGTFAWAWPERDLIVLYFTQSRGGTSGLNLERWIDELLLRDDVTDDDTTVRELMPSLVGEYEADFGSLRNTTLRVFDSDGSLAVDLGRAVMELRPPDEEGRWAFAYSNDTAISFDRDQDGDVYALRLNEGSWSMQAPKVGAEYPVDEDPATFTPYLGRYRMRDKGEIIEVIIDRDRLTLDKTALSARRPLDLFHLLPADEDGFRTYLANTRLRARFLPDETGTMNVLEIYEGDNLGAVADRIEDQETAADDGR